jgi:hypothetical protein
MKNDNVIIMDRHAFFKNSFRKTAEKADQYIDVKEIYEAAHWIRVWDQQRSSIN